MRSGFSVPIILIVILVFVLTPLGYYYFTNKNSQVAVKGVQSQRLGTGFVAYVTSASSGWDMFEYLCKSMSECVSAPESGELYAKVSGDVTEDHEVFIEYSPEWHDFEYLKIYVRQSNATSGVDFDVSPDGSAKVTDNILYVPLNSGEAANLIPVGVFTN